MRFYLDIPFVFPGGIRRAFDLIVPDAEPRQIPLLMWIHGGGWCGGEKRICNEFERFSCHGCAVLSIDYRFSQDAPFPAQLIDCKSALRWARAHAAEYGYNAARVIVGGSSAGGHLAALMGVSNEAAAYDCGENLEQSSAVQGVVDFFGPTDLSPERLPALKDELLALLGGDPALAAQASPLRLISGREPPFLILHGSADPLVPVVQSRAFYQSLTQAGVCAHYCEVPGGDHGFDTPEVYRCLTEFIHTHTQA